MCSLPSAVSLIFTSIHWVVNIKNFVTLPEKKCLCISTCIYMFILCFYNIIIMWPLSKSTYIDLLSFYIPYSNLSFDLYNCVLMSIISVLLPWPASSNIFSILKLRWFFWHLKIFKTKKLDHYVKPWNDSLWIYIISDTE